MLATLPSLVKVFAVFGLILLLNNLRIRLSYCLLIGSAVIGLWMGLQPAQVVRSAGRSLGDPQTVSLLLIVAVILIMSRIMQLSGHMKRIVDSFGRLSYDDRTAGWVMPALIGLLPMPGGALFSAPMVDGAFCEHPASGEQKTAVNYWFRHMWEYWWPLYPGVVLAVALLDVEAWCFMAIMAPMTLVNGAAGAVFILRPLGRMPRQNMEAFSWSHVRRFLWEIMPILVVVLVVIGLAGAVGILEMAGFRFKATGGISVLLGLLASIGWVCAVNRIGWDRIKEAAVSREIPPLLLLVAGIMVFKGAMVDSQAVVQIREELMAFGIPVLLIVLLMPFISGLITGIAIGFVGTSFPLIIPLIQGPHLVEYLSYAALAFSFGYMGMLLSPVHVCFLVTRNYFDARMLMSYRLIIPPAVAVMCAALLIYLSAASI